MENENGNGFPYSISYNTSAGTQFLYLDYSKFKYLIVKQFLKINYKNIITSFVVYSFFVLIGILLNIINRNFILSQIDILIYIWCIISFIIIWKCMSKIEMNKEEIISLKKEIIERKI
ncbi:hypothetical protein QVZ41_14235 [Wenyingzhuangia sp. chi5]|uniref:2TM domain-containing protein n=1 Tax=Wenyingzhuangia gilva TaxID=3057677 RepID=A0ABT8VVK2_9FLAO|nr:hypothetical protein [Wenyingzhuangia sp. chi5]MDO3696007.1 hypothetical protein [Wenyingzhuangia sp. chi5]